MRAGLTGSRFSRSEEILHLRRSGPPEGSGLETCPHSIILSDAEPESRGHRLSRALWPAARAGDTLLLGYPFIRISLQAPYRPIGRFPEEPQPLHSSDRRHQCPGSAGVDFPGRFRSGVGPIKDRVRGSHLSVAFGRTSCLIAVRRNPLPVAPNVSPECGVTPAPLTRHFWRGSSARTRGPAETATLDAAVPGTDHSVLRFHLDDLVDLAPSRGPGTPASPVSSRGASSGTSIGGLATEGGLFRTAAVTG